MDLLGKKVIITGANQGLGKVVASEIVRQGASVSICARDCEKLKAVAYELEESKKTDTQKIIFSQVDISNCVDLDMLYEYTEKELGGIDAVVNNAGIYGPIGPSSDVEWEDLRKTVDINLMGTVYSMRLAVRYFRKYGKGGRIVNLSGGGATSPMPNFLGYAITKSAVVRATETIAKETVNENIFINTIAPGALNTRLLEQVLEAGEATVGSDFYQKSLKQKESGGASMENAAKLIAFLISEKAGKISGRLLSAVWDDWNNIGLHADEIENSDVYTLRRIVPADRGFKWE